MEGKGLKSVIMCVLILGLVVEQIQVEGLICCPTIPAYVCFYSCRLPLDICLSRCGCKIVYGPPDCPPVSNSEAIVSDYCKLGCTSSVCDTINTGVGSKEVKDAVEHCNNVCSRFCTKGVEIAMVNA